MRVASRHATLDDLDQLEYLYRQLEGEMTPLHQMWPIADGLDEPVRESLAEAVADPGVFVLVGTIDDYPLGFLLARTEPMLVHAGDEKIGSIRLIYVAEDAREVAVGEAMRDHIMEEMRALGVSKFDAHVLPGHRLAKNFFESGGFSARSIVMHHDDDR